MKDFNDGREAIQMSEDQEVVDSSHGANANQPIIGQVKPAYHPSDPFSAEQHPKQLPLISRAYLHLGILQSQN